MISPRPFYYSIDRNQNTISEQDEKVDSEKKFDPSNMGIGMAMWIGAGIDNTSTGFVISIAIGAGIGTAMGAVS